MATHSQYSCLENSMDGGAWWATVHGVAKSRTGLSDFTHSLHSIIYFSCFFLFQFQVLSIYFFLGKLGIQFSYITSSPNPQILPSWHCFQYHICAMLVDQKAFFSPPCTYKLLVYSNSSSDLAEFIFPVGALLLLWVLWLFFLPVAQFLPKF